MLGHQNIFFKHIHSATAYLSHMASGTSSWLDGLYGPSLRNLRTAQNMKQQAARKIKCYKSTYLSYRSKTNPYKPCTPVRTSPNTWAGHSLDSGCDHITAASKFWRYRRRHQMTMLAMLTTIHHNRFIMLPSPQLFFMS